MTRMTVTDRDTTTPDAGVGSTGTGTGGHKDAHHALTHRSLSLTLFQCKHMEAMEAPAARPSFRYWYW